jgi:hypothetical protein
MKQDIQFLPLNIPEANLDAAVVSKLNTSGGLSNIDAVAITTEAGLSDVANANKIMVLQADITLTANVTFPSGAVISDGGGVITVSTFDLTFQNNAFKSDYDTTFINLGLSGTINDASTFSNSNITVNWFGLVGDGDRDAGTGTDNRNIFLQVQKIWNYVKGSPRIKNAGIYATSVITSEIYYFSNLPKNIYIMGGSSLYLEQGVAIMVLPNNLDRYDLITIHKSDGSKLMGGELIGDLKNHIWADPNEPTGGTAQWCFGLVLTGGSSYFETTTSLTDFTSDGFIVEAYIQVLYNNTITESVFLNHKNEDISTSTGLAISDSNKSISDLLDITSHLPYGNLLFNGGSFGGSRGMHPSLEYWVSWYDGTANDVTLSDGWLGISKVLQMHDELPILEGATKIRIIIRNPPVWANLDPSLWASDLSKQLDIHPPKIEKNFRQGISNLPTYTKVHDIDFIENGKSYPTATRPTGVFSTPAFHIDIEDSYEKNAHIDIYNCVFGDAAGAILAIGTRNLNIHDNIFKSNEKPKNYGYGNPSVSALVSNGTKFMRNTMLNGSVQLGAKSMISDNIFKNSGASVSLDGGIIQNNHFTNSGGGVYPSGSGICFIRNNTSYYDVPVEYVLAADMAYSGHVVWENNIYDFNNKITSNLLSNGYGTVDAAPRGYIDNILLKGAPTVDDQSYFRYVGVNINKLTSPAPWKVQQAWVQDYLIQNSSMPKLWLNYSNYPITNAGTFTTTTIKNVKITPDNYWHLALSSAALVTDARDLNVVLDNVSFTLLGRGSDGHKFFRLNHYGTSIFKNCLFITDKATATIDLSTVVTGGNVTFIDCEFDSDITTITLRAGDRLKYTKPNVNCPIYADNATALADLGAGYYYRLTGTGEFKITF